MSTGKIHRILRLIVLLQGRRSYSADELASELEVSRRTIFRDLNTLELARIPYYFDQESGGYRINRHFFLPSINLTITEALSLLVLAHRFNETKDFPMLGNATRAAMKIENALPAPIRQTVGDILDNMHIRLGPLAEHEGLDSTFDLLSDAIASKNICRINYQSFCEQEEIMSLIHPMKLLFISRAWYLIAWSKMHSQLRTFKISRIKDLVVSRDKFPTKHVNLEDYFGLAWSMIPEGQQHDVHLVFKPKVAGNVSEVRWHKTQDMQLRPDGSIDFRVRVDGLGEISWWILGYGDQVKVIKPDALKTRIKKIAQAVVSQYERDVL